MTDKIALFAPVPAALFADDFPDAEIVEIRAEHDDPADRARGARVAISDWSGAVRIEDDIVEALAPTCELIQVPAAGLDSVDVEACHDAGIPVASCAGLNAVAVAEWIVWGIIDALRRLSSSDRALRDGEWRQQDEQRYELRGKTVGIIGLGDIGTATAERLAGFDAKLCYWSRRQRQQEEEDRLGVEYRDLDDLIAACDVLVLAVALTADTRGLLSRERIGTMKSSAVVINAARGEITDETALAEAMSEGRLHAAAVDVFSTEPAGPDHPLIGLEYVTVSPHVAGASAEFVGRLLGRVFENIGRALDGKSAIGLVDRPRD